MILNASLGRLLVAGAIAFVGLYIYNPGHLDPDTIALNPENQRQYETWKEQRITANRISDINTLIEQLSVSPEEHSTARHLILWLGNSQLHQINQYHSGDHLAPYWLIKSSRCGDCLYPLGISLPNANFQEHYVLAHLVEKHLPISLIVLELCFDQLREDGLREDFKLMMSDALRADLDESAIGKNILRGWDALYSKEPDKKRPSGLQGFAQERLENALDSGLGRVLPLWTYRPDLRGKFLLDLYFFRNWVFGIKPTTVRRLLKPRYQRNMQALELMMREAAQAGIPMLAYIAPIRHDVPLPYDVSEYESWKIVIAKLSEQYHVDLINLEQLVPAEEWGTYNGDDIDFMHFQGLGHVMLADALRPSIQRLLDVEDR
jgi:hypothetical protein